MNATSVLCRLPPTLPRFCKLILERKLKCVCSFSLAYPGLPYLFFENRYKCPHDFTKNGFSLKRLSCDPVNCVVSRHLSEVAMPRFENATFRLCVLSEKRVGIMYWYNGMWNLQSPSSNPVASRVYLYPKKFTNKIQPSKSLIQDLRYTQETSRMWSYIDPDKYNIQGPE